MSVRRKIMRNAHKEVRSPKKVGFKKVIEINVLTSFPSSSVYKFKASLIPGKFRAFTQWPLKFSRKYCCLGYKIKVSYLFEQIFTKELSSRFSKNGFLL